MKKYVIRIVVTFLTFSLGIFAAGLFDSRHSKPGGNSPHLVSCPPARAPERRVNVTWRRIKIGRVAFSVPAHLRKTGPPGNVGVIEALGGIFVGQADFYMYYAYGREVSSDFNVPSGRRSDLIINGKPAKLYIYEVHEPMNWKDRPTLELVVPDVGDGRTKFEIYASSFDLDLMQQIVDSVEIH